MGRSGIEGRPSRRGVMTGHISVQKLKFSNSALLHQVHRQRRRGQVWSKVFGSLPAHGLLLQLIAVPQKRDRASVLGHRACFSPSLP
jgi:hypothetical protein